MHVYFWRLRILRGSQFLMHELFKVHWKLLEWSMGIQTGNGGDVE